MSGLIRSTKFNLHNFVHSILFVLSKPIDISWHDMTHHIISYQNITYHVMSWRNMKWHNTFTNIRSKSTLWFTLIHYYHLFMLAQIISIRCYNLTLRRFECVEEHLLSVTTTESHPCIAPLYSALLCFTILKLTLLYSTLLCPSQLYSTILRRTLLYSPLLYSSPFLPRIIIKEMRNNCRQSIQNHTNIIIWIAWHDGLL